VNSVAEGDGTNVWSNRHLRSQPQAGSSQSYRRLRPGTWQEATKQSRTFGRDRCVARGHNASRALEGFKLLSGDNEASPEPGGARALRTITEVGLPMALWALKDIGTLVLRPGG
jgi:hypothetical protein